ncbi:hypothetical protein [Streptomyces sp. NPDC020362]|uniref:hypothetical protein n=1 Tax=unclassified Streptomyces TaxID=2593676 RepID=UPI0033D89CD8
MALPAVAAGRHPARPHHGVVCISAVQAGAPGRDDRSSRSLNRGVGGHHQRQPPRGNLDGCTLADEDGHTYTFSH